MEDLKNAEKIFLAGVRNVLPEKLIGNMIATDGNIIRIRDYKFSLENTGNIYLIGAGKASAAMAHYAENILGDRITGGHVVVKYGHSCKLKKVIVTEAGHPVPDQNGFKATEEIVRIARSAGENDLVLCLISGGGSALLADLPEHLLPEELYIVNNLLIRSGASIHEINSVRKHLSRVKGGQLAREVWPATLVTLILSDVPGNAPDVIASGPTVPDTSTFSDAFKTIEKYELSTDITAGVLNYLRAGVAGLHPETPKPGDPVFSRTINLVAGTNLNALEGCRVYAESIGFNTFVVDIEMQGDTVHAAHSVIDTALYYQNNNDIKKPVCLLYGGETTLKVDGNGTGGRNQHLALAAAVRLQKHPGITVLSAGTDGTDGPTDAAGAVVDSGTISRAESKTGDPEKYLEEFDSYNFFRKAGGHIITGPTFTNVMDIIVVLIE